MGFDTNDPGVNTVQEDDLDTPFSELTAVYGTPVRVGNNADLRVQTGQNIEDGSGTLRLGIGDDRTLISNESGQTALDLKANRAHDLLATATEPVRVFDSQGGFFAFTYSTSSSKPGALLVQNTVLDFQAGQASTTTDSMAANPETDTEDGFIEVDISGTRFQIPAYAP
jgi:hypothetical protein